MAFEWRSIVGEITTQSSGTRAPLASLSFIEGTLPLSAFFDWGLLLGVRCPLAMAMAAATASSWEGTCRWNDIVILPNFLAK
jgi:hypothetical protein